MEKFPIHPIIRKVLLYYALLRVESIQWGVSNSMQLIGTRSWHFSSNRFRGRPLKLIVRTIPFNFQPPKSFIYFFNPPADESIAWAIPFNWQHQKSLVCTIPFNGQHPKSIVYTIPPNRQHPKSTVWTSPINGPTPEISCLDNSNQLTSLRNQLLRQFQFIDNTPNLLLTFQLLDGLRHPLSGQFQLINRQSPKSIVWTITTNRQSPKSVAWTIPINSPQNQPQTQVYSNRNCPQLQRRYTMQCLIPSYSGYDTHNIRTPATQTHWKERKTKRQR